LAKRVLAGPSTAAAAGTAAATPARVRKRRRLIESFCGIVFVPLRTAL